MKFMQGIYYKPGIMYTYIIYRSLVFVYENLEIYPRHIWNLCIRQIWNRHLQQKGGMCHRYFIPHTYCEDDVSISLVVGSSSGSFSKTKNQNVQLSANIFCPHIINFFMQQIILTFHIQQRKIPIFVNGNIATQKLHYSLPTSDVP